MIPPARRAAGRGVRRIAPLVAGAWASLAPALATGRSGRAPTDADVRPLPEQFGEPEQDLGPARLEDVKAAIPPQAHLLLVSQACW